MSDDIAPDEPDDGDFEPLPEGHDWLLSQLVRLADIGVDIGLTVMANGETITGTLAGQRAYFEATRAAVNTKTIGNDTVREDHMFNAALEALGEVAQSEGPVPHPEFLHLKDAHVISPSGLTPTHGGVWWRGKIASVDGFWLGSANPRPQA
ncbi:MAG TPA: hypothetical protein VIL42_03480 [Sphingomicrobium sp.]|jgi:hypothetical protein